ncbi:MAG TPA: Tim44/TimA family putative adaptor protein [Terriglobales bacterium]|nr:Tim44/TimA family putative adaptor protein [Terriglobales bacterium]
MPLDLILFAAIAVFCGWRLYLVLGRRTGNERSFDPLAGRPADNMRRPAENEAETANEAEKPGATVLLPRDQRRLEAALASTPEEARRGLEAITKADPSFNPVDFLSGAKVAFDMILAAFAKGDNLALRPLLNDEVYRNFNAAITDRQRLNQKLNSTLVGILGHEIVGAELAGEGKAQEARVTVKFTSQQINVTTDASGASVDGSPTEVHTITDLWTFARQLKSRDPNWQLVATDAH